jgi:hypothetical protein
VKLRKPATFLIWALLIAVQLWQEFEKYAAFQADSPGAGIWPFLASRGSVYLLILIAALAILALAIWIEKRLPAVDADMTEFHEKEVR